MEADSAQSRGWAQRWGLPSFGALTFGALFVCVVSGIVVATGYDPAQPVKSLLDFELTRPYGWFFRGLHAWSGHLSFLGLVAHTVEYLVREGERQTSRTDWVVATASLPVVMYLMLGGRALVGDTEAGGVASIMRGLLVAFPWVGSAFADLLVGREDMPRLLTHHVSSATLLLFVLVFAHGKRVAPGIVAVAVALGIAGLVALAVRPALALTPGVELRGPWFMGGLRLLLQVAPVWLAGVLFPLTVLLALGALPWIPTQRVRLVRFALLGVAVVYGAATLMASVS